MGAPYHNFLTLNFSQTKAVPYAGAPRSDGNINHGFRDLKGDPGLLNSIPELTDDPALRDLVAAINQPSTGLFSVGCVSTPDEDSHGRRRVGYVEFALNSKSLAADASNYFPLFFQFGSGLHWSKFATPFQFKWTIEATRFFDAGFGGFCCAVFLSTGYSQAEDKVTEAWKAGLGVLAGFLASVPPQRDDFLYHSAGAPSGVR